MVWKESILSSKGPGAILAQYIHSPQKSLYKIPHSCLPFSSRSATPPAHHPPLPLPKSILPFLPPSPLGPSCHPRPPHPHHHASHDASRSSPAALATEPLSLVTQSAATCSVRANGDARGGANPRRAGEGPPRSAPPFCFLRNKRSEVEAVAEPIGRLVGFGLIASRRFTGRWQSREPQHAPPPPQDLLNSTTKGGGNNEDDDVLLRRAGGSCIVGDPLPLCPPGSSEAEGRLFVVLPCCSRAAPA